MNTNAFYHMRAKKARVFLAISQLFSIFLGFLTKWQSREGFDANYAVYNSVAPVHRGNLQICYRISPDGALYRTCNIAVKKKIIVNNIPLEFQANSW